MPQVPLQRWTDVALKREGGSKPRGRKADAPAAPAGVILAALSPPDTPRSADATVMVRSFHMEPLVAPDAYARPQHGPHSGRQAV